MPQWLFQRLWIWLCDESKHILKMTFLLQDPFIGGSLLLAYTTGYVAPLLLAASFAGALQVCKLTWNGNWVISSRVLVNALTSCFTVEQNYLLSGLVLLT